MRTSAVKIKKGQGAALPLFVKLLDGTDYSWSSEPFLAMVLV